MKTFREENVLAENMLNGMNGKLDTAGKKISELEDVAAETLQNETEKNKKKTGKKWTVHWWAVGQL